jgi:hypothetical protein
VLLPVAGFRQVDVFGGYVGLHPFQDIQISAVFVEHDNIGVALRLELRDKVLADQTSAAGEHYF